jgi:hypothetical protein
MGPRLCTDRKNNSNFSLSIGSLNGYESESELRWLIMFYNISTLPNISSINLLARV